MIRRLLLTYLSLALLILAGLAIPLGFLYQRSEQQRAFAELEHDAEVLAAFIDAALSGNQPDQVGVLARESAQRWNGRVDVVDASLRPLTGDHPGAGPDAAADLRAALAGGGRVSRGLPEVAGVAMMSVAVPIHPGKPAQGALRVSVPTAPMTAHIHRFWTVLAGVAVIVLAGGGLVAAGLARWIARPVRILERATRHLAEGAAPPTAPPPGGPPELRRLAETFHATAVRLQDLITAQRAFTGHASHQLKTPLAALRLRLENLEPDVAPAGAANVRAALAETDRLATLVDTLLAMTRTGHAAPPAEPVAVAAAVAGRLGLWRPVAEGRGITLTVGGAAGTVVRAVPGAVEQMLDNLLSNALNVAPAGSAVAVTWQPVTGPGGAPMVELHVVDAGPGLDRDQRTRAMEPFWRAPGAVRGGTGLGLALVRKLAEACGGQARLDPARTCGVDAVVALPAAPVEAAAALPARAA